MSSKEGRPPEPLEIMQRIKMLRQWYFLSDTVLQIALIKI
jgi:hypothetical protein